MRDAGRNAQTARFFGDMGFDEIAAQRQRVRDIAVMRDREAARGKVGIERLDVPEPRFAGRRVADVADRDIPLEGQLAEPGELLGQPEFLALRSDPGFHLFDEVGVVEPGVGKRRNPGDCLHTCLPPVECRVQTRVVDPSVPEIIPQASRFIKTRQSDAIIRRFARRGL